MQPTASSGSSLGLTRMPRKGVGECKRNRARDAARDPARMPRIRPPSNNADRLRIPKHCFRGVGVELPGF